MICHRTKIHRAFVVVFPKKICDDNDDDQICSVSSGKYDVPTYAMTTSIRHGYICARAAFVAQTFT